MPEIPADIQQQAGDIQDRFNKTVTAIRSDGDLTEDARTRRLAVAHKSAEGEMDRLRQRWGGGASVSAESLTRQVFGASAVSGMDAISARDAGDRASQITDADEALRLVRWSMDNGDDVLAQAVARHAFDRRGEFIGGDWGGVVDAYAEARPAIAEKLTELANVRRDTINTSLAAGFIFSIHKPRELERLGLTALRQLQG